MGLVETRLRLVECNPIGSVEALAIRAEVAQLDHVAKMTGVQRDPSELLERGAIARQRVEVDEALRERVPLQKGRAAHFAFLKPAATTSLPNFS